MNDLPTSPVEALYNVLDIVRGTTVDGPGFRTSIYLAGCRHRCPGCHNPGSWDSNGGSRMTLNEIMEVVDEEEFNVTLSGGDPLFNPESTALLTRTLAGKGYKVWIYTGYVWEEIVEDPGLLAAVAGAEAVVDGPFISALHDPDLLFRGSSNQRIIDVKASLERGETVLLG